MQYSESYLVKEIFNFKYFTSNTNMYKEMYASGIDAFAKMLKMFQASPRGESEMATFLNNKKVLDKIDLFKPIFIESETAQELYSTPCEIKQDYTMLNLPFPEVMIRFVNPIKIRIYDFDERGERTEHEDEINAVFLEQQGVNFINSDVDTAKKLGENISSVMSRMFKSKTRFHLLKPSEIKIIFCFTDGESWGPREVDTQRLPHYFDDEVISNGDKEINILRRKTPNDLAYNFLVNLINYLNATNIELKPYHGCKSDREKAAATNTMLPPKFYSVIIKYPREITEMRQGTLKTRALRRGFNHMFDVRGHYRHLVSERYKRKGEKIWVKNYRKGSGFYIPNSYYYDWVEKHKKIEKNEECTDK